MKPITNYRNFQRNSLLITKHKNTPQTSLKKNKKTKANTISSEVTHNSLSIKESPTLIFPVPNDEKISNLFSPRNIPKTFPYRNKTLNENTLNRNNKFHKNKIILSKLHRPVVNFKEAKISQEKLKHLNILDFGGHLKIYDEKEKKFKKKVILQKVDRQLDEIYYDYDKNNKKVIINSFSGNNAELLRNKISFVSGIMNYLYPKIVLNKMEFLKKMKKKELREEKLLLDFELKGKYFNLKHKNPKENAAISKYFYIDEFENLKFGQYLTRPKAIVNNNVISKLKYDYDFM